MVVVSPIAIHYLQQLPLQNKKNVPNELPQEKLIEIATNNPVVDTFLKLAIIPSPTIRPGHIKEFEMKQNMGLVRDLTAKLFIELDPRTTTSVDQHGSLIINTPASPGYEHKRPLMFMGHLDVVPADLDNPLRQVYPTLINHATKDGLKEYIATDGTTTLGADDKAQVAIIWDVIRRSIKEPHVAYEVVLAPDEEENSDSLINLDTSQFKSKDVIIIDNEEEFEITTGCASYVEIKIDISGLKSEHSAVSNQDDYISASDILMELYQAIGNRVVKWDTRFQQPLISKNIYECEIKRAPTNALPTQGHIALSLRSLNNEEQDNEISRIRKEIERIKEKYKHYKNINEKLKINIQVQEQFPPWEGSMDSTLVKLLEQAAHDIGQEKVKIKPEHGASQANLLVPKRNAYGEEFTAVVISPNMEGHHSIDEKVDWKSMVTVSDWLYKFVEVYSSKN